MKIDKIIFKDFRQFFGEQELAFSMDDEKNVTLIHAENGVGKTAILNAIWWTFFGETTPGFERPHDIVSDAALKEGKTTAEVRIYFEHDDHRYVIVRRYSQETHGLASPVVNRIVGGNHRSLSNPNDFIDSVLPLELAKYFLFEGEEGIRVFSKSSSATTKAIKGIIGCGLAELAANDLLVLKNKLVGRIKRQPKASKLDALDAEISSAELEIEQGNTFLQSIEAAVEELEKEADALQGVLRKMSASKVLQKRRDSLGAQLDAAQDRQVDARNSVIQWTNSGGLPLLSDNLIRRANEFILSAVDEGILPAPHNKTVVEKLLLKGECICGTPLQKGTKEYEAVERQLDHAADSVMIRRVSGITGYLKSLDDRRKSSVDNLNQYLAKYDQEGDAIRALEGELKDVSNEIQKVDFGDIALKEERLRNIKSEVNEKNDMARGASRNIGSLTADLKRLRVEKKELMKKQKDVTPIRRQIDLFDDAHGMLTSLVNNHVKLAKTRIRDSINKILETHARRDYMVKFGAGAENFSLGLYLVGEPDKSRVTSRGEKQLLAMAFAASLVSEAKRRVGDDHKLYIPGTTAPVILDAPFGSTDTIYSQAVTSIITEMAEQVVILVSKKQGSKEVLDSLKSRIGMEYILVSENTSKGKNKTVDAIKIGGANYQQSVWGAERDMTRIVEI